MRAIESGADDFVAKPSDQAELLARVRSLVRIKSYHDTTHAEGELAAWNRELEARVGVTGRAARARRPPATIFVGRRSRTSWSTTSCCSRATPRDRRRLLRPARLHLLRGGRRARGGHARARRVPPGAGREDRGARRDARAVHRRRGDGVLQRPRPRPTRRDRRSAWRSRCATRTTTRVRVGASRSRPRAGDRGRPGLRHAGEDRLPGRSDYAAIGSVTNLAARLCAEAGWWQVLVTDRVLAQVEDRVAAELVGDVQPKGFSRPVRVHDVVAGTIGR